MSESRDIKDFAKVLGELASSAASNAPESPDEETKNGIKHANRQQKAMTAGERSDRMYADVCSSHEKHLTEIRGQIKFFHERCKILESQVAHLIPRNSKLEQAEKTSKHNTDMSAVAWAIGGLAVGMAGLVVDGPLKWGLSGGGSILTMWGAFALVMSNRRVWTDDLPDKNQQSQKNSVENSEFLMP